VILDLAHKAGLHFDVALIDTGLLFPETLALADEVEARYGLRIQRVKAQATLSEQEAKEGKDLWLRDPDRCCQLRKVEPMRRLLSGYNAWITGIRRDQSEERSHASAVEWDEHFGLVKLAPLIDWSGDRVRGYLQEKGLPYNRLLDQGFRSIGCMPCTRPSSGESERSGRWAGLAKTECGLHSISRRARPVETINSLPPNKGTQS
jgi:phosphoadenosine phosphosulfate reductase